MDFQKLDSIISDYIRKNKFYIDTLPMVTDYSKKVLSEEFFDVNNEWSRKMDINESIDIVYRFLQSIDTSMANQFMNIMNSKDTNNNPYVNILPRSEYHDGKDEVSEGKVFIYYDNSPNDAFVILHEMLHKMNEAYFINDFNFQDETSTRDYMGETVSILGEMMLGKYMVENRIITENDFNMRKNFRINEAKEDARDVIIENELINLKLQGKDISYDNLSDLFNKYNECFDEYSVLKDEANDLRRINKILNNDDLSLRKSQRYVIAQVVSNDMLKRDTLKQDFLQLYNEVGNVNSDLRNVYNTIISKSESSKSKMMGE